MQLRMLARRSLSGSMTVVGDIAQATGPWAPQSWDEVTRHLSPQRAQRLVELTVSYRTPAEVVALAAAGPRGRRPGDRAAPPRAPVGVPSPGPADDGHDIDVTVARLVREEVAAVTPGRVAVLGPAVMLPELIRALDEAGLDPIDPRDPSGEGLAVGLVVLPADETNGFWIDSVVVVEPTLVASVGDEPAGEGPPVATTRGLRTLYVALDTPHPAAHRRPRAAAPRGPVVARPRPATTRPLTWGSVAAQGPRRLNQRVGTSAGGSTSKLPCDSGCFGGAPPCHRARSSTIARPCWPWG